MLKFLLSMLAVAALFGCASADTKDDRKEPAKAPDKTDVKLPKWLQDPETVKGRVNLLRKYVAAIDKFNSTSEADWREAQRDLELVGDFTAQPDEKELIRLTKSADSPKAAAAAKELGRRARIWKCCWVFLEEDVKHWSRARRDAQSLGDDATLALSCTLLYMLVNTYYFPFWQSVRFQLVELGDIAFDLTVELARTISAKIPPEKVFVEVPQQQEFVQVFLALVQFGARSSAIVKEMSNSPAKNIRRLVAQALGDTRDIMYSDILIRYIKQDKEWEVRYDAYAAVGRVVAFPDVFCETIVWALSNEKDDACLQRAIASCGDTLYPKYAEHLVGMLQRKQSVEVESAVIAAMGKFAGTRFRNRGEVLAWWEKNK